MSKHASKSRPPKAPAPRPARPVPGQQENPLAGKKYRLKGVEVYAYALTLDENDKFGPEYRLPAVWLTEAEIPDVIMGKLRAQGIKPQE
jgi:hypothetical protein